VITAVTIDAHGVLLLPDPVAIRTVLEEFACQPNDATCWKAHYQMVRVLDGMARPDWPTMNRSFAQALGVPPFGQDDAGSILAEKVYLGPCWIPAPGASAALVHLIDNGFGVAVVSNTVHGELVQLLSRTMMCGVDGDLVQVAAIIDSKTIGIEKPDPQPFLLALEALGVGPESCIHVGDSLHSDVVGAINVGMTAIHVDPLHLCEEVTHEHSNSLADFVDALVGQ
jgi:putative hydrolase of the HAD superfamily